jgi:hypothetical protein
MRWPLDFGKLIKSRQNKKLCDIDLERRSFELHRTRLSTRRCSLENSSHRHNFEHEELHTVGDIVINREDSITLAKRRLSHDHSGMQQRLDSGSSLGDQDAANRDSSMHHYMHWGSVSSTANGVIA